MEEYRTKTAAATVIKAEAGKPIVAIVSTQDVDRSGDVVYQGPNSRGRGWLLDEFNAKGGRVYWMHDPFRPNLAKASAAVVDAGLQLTLQFDTEDDFAMKLDSKIRRGFLSEFSVGYKPQPGYVEPNEHGGLDFYEQKLGEVSIVNMGDNMNTEVTRKMADQIAEAREVKAALDVWDSRLREVEAWIMRKDAEQEEAEREATAAHLLATIESAREALRGRTPA